MLLPPSAPDSTAARGLPLIRDAEIEGTLRSWAQPLAEAANLVPENLHLHVVRDADINAFVAGGQRIFMTTGLLARAEHHEAVMGVIAHELGHIAGGHAARMQGARENAADGAMLGVLAGLVVGMLGRPDAGMAVSTKLQELGLESFASYSRTQERSADRVAVDLLGKTGISTRGLLGLLEDLERQELLHQVPRNTYLRTHPVTRERIAYVRRHATSTRDPVAEQSRAAQYDRVVAKLEGFLEPPAKTLRKLDPDDRSVKARYTRAIALYRDSRLEKALREIDSLLHEFPEDPYFWELRGQMLFEHGRLQEALPAYERALTFKPDEPLLLAGLAHVQIEIGDSAMLDRAMTNLKNLIRRDPLLPLAWRLSAIAYGQTGQRGMAALSQAESELLRGQFAHARDQAIRARHLLPEGSSAHLRAEDILHITRRVMSR